LGEKARGDELHGGGEKRKKGKGGDTFYGTKRGTPKAGVAPTIVNQCPTGATT